MIVEGLTRLTLQSYLLELFFAVGAEKPMGFGTGFVVATPAGIPFLLTARHNVAGKPGEVEFHELAIAVRAQAHPPNMRMIIKPAPRVRVRLRDESGSPLWYEHPTLGASADVAAVPINPRTPWMRTAEGVRSMSIGPASRVSVVGFPFANLPLMRWSATWSTGFIASEPEEDFGDERCFLIDCRARPGQSGSPVYRFARPWETFETEDGHAQSSDSSARLLGLYSGRIDNESDLGRVWKYQVLRELLEAIENGTASTGK